MLCEECGKNEANVMIQQINGDGTEITRHLCFRCTLQLRAQMSGRNADFPDLMGAIMGRAMAEAAKRGTPDKTCDTCGTSLRDLQEKGVLGCADCYRKFHEEIEEYLINRHGSALFAGKMPEGRQRVNDDLHELRKLKQQLTRAIEDEDYEQAAALRDSIRTLNGRIRGGEAANG